MASTGSKIGSAWANLVEDNLYTYFNRVLHPLPTTVLYSRNMKDVWKARSGITLDGSSVDVNTWAITFHDLPDTKTAILWWDLPENAKEIFCAWAMEPVASGVILEMRFIDTDTNNYVSVYEDASQTTADHLVKKYIGGVLSTLDTEAVDLYEGTPHEYAFLYTVPSTKQPSGWYHSYRGEYDHRDAPDVRQLVYRVKLFGGVDAALTQVNRIMFRAYNGTGGAADAALQVHFDTFKPFVIQYDTVGFIEYS
jgi:hypothetical protein